MNSVTFAFLRFLWTEELFESLAYNMTNKRNLNIEKKTRTLFFIHHIANPA